MLSIFNPTQITKESFQKDVLELAPYLSYQGPIGELVCLNPLAAFQQLDFYQAIREASQFYGNDFLMPLSFYAEALKSGRLNRALLKEKFIKGTSIPESGVTDDHSYEAFEDLILNWKDTGTKSHSNDSLRRALIHTFHVELPVRSTQVLVRLINNYLDQGVSTWPMPRESDGFFASIRSLMNDSYVRPEVFRRQFAMELLQMPAEECAAHALKSIISWDPSGCHGHDSKGYLRDLMFATPGWSAMVWILQQKPQSICHSRPVTLSDFMALGLLLDAAVMEASAIAKRAPWRVVPKIQSFDHATNLEFKLKTICHATYEDSLYEETLVTLKSQTLHQVNVKEQLKSIQAVFCIDDRECSLRRYLELQDDAIETFGTAGFFGMDFFYQDSDAVMPAQNCPIVITPKHLVRSSRASSGTSTGMVPLADSPLAAAGLIQKLKGILASIRLVKTVFFPELDSHSSTSVQRNDDRGELHLFRFGHELDPQSGLLLGYSFDELATRIHFQLVSTGLKSRLGELVVVVGHGSTTVNNPHFAAYDCGACMGKPGTPNARAFVQAANHPEVRKRLRELDCIIPAHCHFVAAVHDTTRDEIVFFDTNHLPDPAVKNLHRFDRAVREALQLNAQERCRRFLNTDENILPQLAAQEVIRRSTSIFEPRPEFTHTSNALAIVGRRHLTKNVFLDRRAFLNSYDPTLDDDGSVLAQILGAVIPVGSGINLTYFLSRMDNLAFGAGTKLPHNIMGLLGVGIGVSSDIFTGLPEQMVEQHEPVRLMVIVEQSPDIALKALRQNPNVFQLVQNEWVHFAALDPHSGKIFRFKKEEMRLVEVTVGGQPQVYNSKVRPRTESQPVGLFVPDTMERKGRHFSSPTNSGEDRP
jgi:uncharacterized protein